MLRLHVADSSRLQEITCWILNTIQERLTTKTPRHYAPEYIQTPRTLRTCTSCFALASSFAVAFYGG